MPSGVAVLGRLGLLDAVGGRRVAGVRYHGFGLEAERVPRRRRRARDDAGAAAPAPRRGARHGGPRDARRARLRGRRRRRRRRRARPRRRAGRRWGDPPRRAGGGRRRPRLARAPLARARRSGAPRERAWGSARITGWPRAATRPRRLEIFVAPGHGELYVAPLPDGEHARRGALGGARARRPRARRALGRWIGETPRLAALLDGAEPLTDVAGRAAVAGRARAPASRRAPCCSATPPRATDPLTAGGLAHALVTAERLAAIAPRALAGDLRRLAAPRRRRAPPAACAPPRC